ESCSCVVVRPPRMRDAPLLTRALPCHPRWRALAQRFLLAHHLVRTTDSPGGIIALDKERRACYVHLAAHWPVGAGLCQCPDWRNRRGPNHWGRGRPQPLGPHG